MHLSVIEHQHDSTMLTVRFPLLEQDAHVDQNYSCSSLYRTSQVFAKPQEQSFSVKIFYDDHCSRTVKRSAFYVKQGKDCWSRCTIAISKHSKAKHLD